MIIKTGLGQDSHKFEKKSGKDLVLAGIKFDYPFGLKGNSDADVIFHSITNSISSITGKNILGDVADQLVKTGIKDSAKYLQIALDDLGDWKINHIAVALECAKPKIANHVEAMKESIDNTC